MSTISVPNTFTTGDSVTAAKLNANNTTIYNEFNGNIENANIKAGAAIVPTKLDLANGISITQTKTTGNAITITRDLTSASTDSAVVQITQDNSGDDQSAVAIKNDGTGPGLLVSQVGTLADYHNAFKVSTGAAQTNVGAYLAFILQDNASSTVQALTVRDDGTGGCLWLNQDGNGIALSIDSEATTSAALYIASAVNNDQFVFLIKDASNVNCYWGFYRNTDVHRDAVMRLGGSYIWVDSTGDLRVNEGQPTSDTDGTVVGSQS